MDRRTFLKLAGVALGSAVVGREAEASVAPASDAHAVLIDVTHCEGCRTCEMACAEANGLPEPDWSDDFSYEAKRLTTDKQWTVVNQEESDGAEVYVKQQCMHCTQPACAAGCLTRALIKTPEGPVIWRESKCMGCRFCMISCPFDVPKFEYHSAVPKIQKCRMCWERLQEGQQPACVEECPNDALMFGKRSELIETARERIYQRPGEYVSHIYGEHEVGGTGVLYISPVPFKDLGFRTDLGEIAYPEYTRDFLTSVPLVEILWPAALLGLRHVTRREHKESIESELTTEGDE